MTDLVALGVFLRSRRERLDPAAQGLPVTRRRRVPGLRREEVAAAAGVSVEYYARIEQHRSGAPSFEVLDALADALQLTGAERTHARQLAGHSVARGGGDSTRAAPPGTRPAVEWLIGTHLTAPAILTNQRFDVLNWNRDAQILFQDLADVSPGSRNLARYLFLDPGSHRLYLDWKDVARATVAHLRAAVPARSDDQQLANIIRELRTRSDRFREYWADYEVDERAHALKRLWHPDVGQLDLHIETLLLPAEPDLSIVVLTPEPGSATADKLALLRSSGFAASVSTTPTGR